MDVVKVKICDLKEWKNNARLHTQRNLLTIKNSLEKFGQVKPIVVQKSSMSIIAGNGTFQAAKALGWEEIECHIVDMDDKIAETYAILDNRAGDQSEWDQQKLIDSLKMLQDEDEELLDLTGFDATELDNMLSFLEDDPLEIKEPKEKKEKKKEVDFSADTDNQVSFILMGCPFVITDEDKILELKGLLQYFADDSQECRSEVSKKVFDAIEQTLHSHYME